MADNYCQGSSYLKLTKKQRSGAQAIIDRVTNVLESNEDEPYCGCNVTVDDYGVWFSTDESLNPEHVAEIAKALVEELKIDAPFFSSWAYTCSKQRIDEFGGGAFVVQRGKETYWTDAMSQVQKHIINTSCQL